MAKKTPVEKKSDDSVVYKVPAAFAVMTVMIILLQKLGRYYKLADGFSAVRPWLWLGMIVFGLLAAVSIVLFLVCKKPGVRSVFRYAVVLSLLAFVSCWLLHAFWIKQIKAVYFLHAYIYCLYMVELLYGWEFFFYSAATAFAGFVFFRYSKGLGPNVNTIIPAVILVLILAATALTAFFASKNSGVLTVGKRRISLFPSTFNPTLLYVVCALWLVCLIACFLFGAVFAYYCMFASIAFELIAAVYYTFQLK